MGLSIKNNKFLNILFAPFKAIATVVRWFFIGFFKVSSYFIEYLLDILFYMLKGAFTLFKLIYLFFKYEFKGIVACLNGVLDIFKYAYKGLKAPFERIGESFKKVDKSSTTNPNLRKKGKKKVGLLEKLNNISIIKSFNDNKLAQKGLLFIDPESAEAKRSEILQAYRYTAKDKDGKIIRGSFYGYSKLDVNSYLINEGYDVYEIITSKWINFYYGQKLKGSKLKNKDLVFWLQQLGTYIRSGIPLTTAVKILGNQMGKTTSRKRLFDSIVYELTMGSSFSKAMEKQTHAFPELLVNMIKAAEATGQLEETLFDMADYYSEIEKTRKQMVSAMTYPSVILVFAVGVLTFIMLYVVPQFTSIYTQSGIKITGTTLVLINISNFLKSNIFYLIIIIILIIIIMVFLYKKVKAFRIIMQTFAMKLPVIGNIIIYNEMTIFTKTFASLLKNNVYITESIEILSNITKNEIYKDIMYNTITNIAKGDKISDAFKDHWAIPEVAYFMIVTGESTGELASMMLTVSEYYQDLHRNSVNTIKSLIEPILIVFLAVIVGVVILSVIIPMFDLYSSIEM